MPQPISKVNSRASISIANNTDNPTIHRPDLALRAMGVLAEWSLLESFMRDLFLTMLGANPGPAAAIYSRLTSTATQRTAFRAVAEFSISSQDEKDVLDCILAIFQSLAGRRNNIAHNIWGYSPDIPDGVLLGDVVPMTEFGVALREYMDAIARNPTETHPPAPRAPKDRILIWYAHDFDDLSKEIQALIGCVSDFRFVLMRSHPWNAAGRSLQQLLSLPQIQKCVSRKREDRENKKAAHPPSP